MQLEAWPQSGFSSTIGCSCTAGVCHTRILVWLVENNVLYRNVTIDYELIESWEPRFVPEVLVETAIITTDNYQLPEGGKFYFFRRKGQKIDKIRGE